MLLAVYLLLLAGFLLFLNLKSGSAFSKRASYCGMWLAIIGSVVVAVKVGV